MRLLLNCLIYLFTISAMGQYQPRSIKIDIEEGLASHTVYDIKQDDDGAMLITTSRGLQRYNGVDFKLLSPLILGNLSRVSKNKYVGRNFNDSICLIESDGRVTPVHDEYKNEEGYTTFFEDGNAVYRVDGMKLILFSRNGKLIQKVIYTSKNSKIKAGRIKDDKATLVVANNLLELNLRDNHVSKFSEKRLDQTMLIESQNNLDLIEVESKEVLRWNGKSLTTIRTDLFKGLQSKITIGKVLPNGNILLGTYGGLFYFDPNWNLIGHYYSDEIISAIQVDMEGNIWIGTLQNGIHLIPSLTEFEFLAESLSGKNNHISKAYLIDENLILGLYDGKLIEINKKGETTFEYQFPVKSEIQSIFYDVKKKHLYVYCHELFKFDWNTKKVIETLGQNYGPVKSMCELNGSIYAGTNSRIFNLTNGECIKSSWVSSLHSDGKIIYAVTFDGLQVFNEDLTPHIKYSKNNAKKIRRLCFSENKIYGISENELFLIDSELHPIVTYPLGRINEFTIHSNKLFIESEGKIHAYDLSNKKWTNNLANINETAVMMCVQNNRLIVSGMEKIHQIDYLKHSQLNLAQLFIREVSGTFASHKDQFSTQGLDNNIEIKCEILPYYGSKARYIRYRLDGLNSIWTELPANHLIVRENRLPIGNYNIEIQHSINGIQWSESTLLPIEVHPFFYQTWWFKLIAILTFSILVLFLVRAQFRKLKLRSEERIRIERLKNQAISSELKALRSQMNPHFIFNSLSVIQTKILENKSESAYYNLNAFSKLLRQSLEYTSKEWISLQNELDFIENYIKLEIERFNNEIEYEIINGFNGNLSDLMFPSFLTQPFVENAFRHGLMHKKSDRKLSIKVEGLPTNYTVEIIDNGIGIQASEKINAISRKEHKSYAVESIYDRIDLLNNSNKNHFSVDIESNNEGTRVRINYTMKL